MAGSGGYIWCFGEGSILILLGCQFDSLNFIAINNLYNILTWRDVVQ